MLSVREVVYLLELTRRVAEQMIGKWLACLGLLYHLGGAYSAPAQAFPMEGDLLAGRTVVIDPGHGGFDPGARGRQAAEDRINLEVALALKAWFQRAGARVLMSWSKPKDIPRFKKFRVTDRIDWINRTHGDVLIDIHCNSGYHAYRGPQTFYWNGAGSYHLARDIQQELQYWTHTRRGVTRINQYVLRYAKMPAVNVEIGFISNPREEALLMSSQYQRDIAWYIFVGTERWFLKGRWPEKSLSLPPPTHLLVRD